MANDVEENPGPTIYDVVVPNKTISADFSQGNTKKLKQNAGKQYVAMSLTVILYNEITNNLLMPGIHHSCMSYCVLEIPFILV